MNKFGIVTVIFLVFAMADCAVKEKKKHLMQMGGESNKHMKEKPQTLRVKMGEFLDITCPQYDSSTPESEREMFKLYPVVNKKAYDNCDFEDKVPVLSCTSPLEENTLTLKFQAKSPSPLGFKFKYGTSYYYIAIQHGETTCHNAMKLEIKVENEVVVPEIEEIFKPSPKPNKTRKTTPTTTTRTSPKFISTTTQRSIAESRKGNSASSVTNIKFLISLIALLTLGRNL